MKKTISLIAVLAMMLTMVLPAFAETVVVDEALLGTWILDDFGAEFTFNDDGTYIEVFGEMEGGGSYKIVDNQLYIDGSGPIAYIIDGDTMLFDDNGMEMLFTRKTGDAGAAVNVYDYLGTWILTETSLGFSFDLKLIFDEDGTYTMAGPDGETNGVYMFTSEGVSFDGGEFEPCTFGDDTLTLEEGGISLIFTRETWEDAGI